MNDYRSRLRSSPRHVQHGLLTNMASDDVDMYLSFANSPSPSKNKLNEFSSPHKSGYFLRTPSPLRKLKHFLHSPTKSSQNELPGTPSPHKPTSATDLFGNKSLLDNLDVPDDWDENFLNNFQDDWLMGIGAEDLESLGKSPLKSPGRGQTFLTNNAKSTSSSLVSPFKSPLLTSSPKHSGSPLWGKMQATVGGRPATRQRKLFLHSPERQINSQSRPSNASTSVPWNGPLPFSSMLDASTSSALSDGFETTSSIHSISSYLKNFDDEDVSEDLPVMPPVGWTSKSGKGNRNGKGGGKGTSKLKRDKRPTSSHARQDAPQLHQHNLNITGGISQGIGHKKLKMEPQFTLLRPHTDLRTHQISLRTTPVTPPNKIKISRDFSQIQTLPSKEQLRIVRNRFTETLNKAVEQVIEKEKSKRTQSNVNVNTAATISATNCQQSTSQHIISPGLSMPMQAGLPLSGIPQAVIAVKPPPSKRRKR